MKKFETKVHRKTLNPFFNETFQVSTVTKADGKTGQGHRREKNSSPIIKFCPIS
jgi:hypothetical protein